MEGEWIGHERRDLLNGINALIKGTPERSLALSPMWEHRKKSATWKRAFTRTQPFGILILTSRSQKCEKQISIAPKLPSLFCYSSLNTLRHLPKINSMISINHSNRGKEINRSFYHTQSCFPTETTKHQGQQTFVFPTPKTVLLLWWSKGFFSLHKDT